MADYFVHPTALVDEPVTIGAHSKIWHFCHIMPHVVMGTGCSLGQNVFVASGVVLGNNVKIQNNVSLYEGVICEDDVFLGPSMVFTNIRNPRSGVVRKGQYTQTYLEQGATLGANSTIVCGTRLGRYCFVGAGAVITKDVPAYALVVGNPARQIGWMSEYGHRLNFDAEGMAACPESGYQYRLENGIVSRVS
ncbi:MAG: acyltransferase [Bacteroidia bacterium]|nr:acyltransferase [Bacteroidia bacterium]